MDVRFLVFIMFIGIITIIECHQLDEMGQIFGNSDSKKIYCGRHLAQTLSAVCRGVYNTLTKKQGDSYDTNGGYPFKSKASATSLMSNFRSRKKRGVFNECCEKPCSYDELSSYCGGSQKKR